MKSWIITLVLVYVNSHSQETVLITTEYAGYHVTV